MGLLLFGLPSVSHTVQVRRTAASVGKIIIMMTTAVEPGMRPTVRMALSRSCRMISAGGVRPTATGALNQVLQIFSWSTGYDICGSIVGSVAPSHRSFEPVVRGLNFCQ